MQVLTHNTIICCPHGVVVQIPQFGHPLTVDGVAILTAEEVEAGVIACVDQAKCVSLSVTGGRAKHLIAAGGKALTPVLHPLSVKTNIGPCEVSPATGSLSGTSG